MGLGLFFDFKSEQKINSIIYCNQVLLESLKQFWDESCRDFLNFIAMKDGAPVHKGACNGLRE